MHRSVTRAVALVLAYLALAVTAYAQARAGSALPPAPSREPATSSRGSSLPRPADTYNRQMENINRNTKAIMDAIYGDRSRSSRSGDTSDDNNRGSRRPSYESRSADTYVAAAPSPTLTERLEAESRLEESNRAIEAEMNKPDPNELIELEMTREEFAPMANQLAQQVLDETADAPGDSEGDLAASEIAPAQGGILLEAFRTVREKAGPLVQQTQEKAQEFISELPETIFGAGLDLATEENVRDEMLESIAPSRESLASAEPSIGSAIKDKIYKFVGGQAWSKIQEHSQNGYVDLLMKQRGIDSSNSLERANIELEVRAHPLTGLLPELARAGANVPKAVYEYGKSLVDAGSKLFGLAADSLTNEDDK